MFGHSGSLAAVYPTAIPPLRSVSFSFASFLALIRALNVNAFEAGLGSAFTHPVPHGILSHPLFILFQGLAYEIVGIRLGGIQTFRVPDRGLEPDQHPELCLDPGRRKQSVLRVAFTHSAQCGQV
jgi:hypothetical protein